MSQVSSSSTPPTTKENTSRSTPLTATRPSSSRHASTPPAKRTRSSSLASVSSLTQNSHPGKLSIGIVGAGNMARAISEGMISSGQVTASQITASATSKNSENLKKIKALGVNTSTLNSVVMTTSDIIIIAVKPYLVLDVLSEIHDFYTAAQSSGDPPKNLRPLIVSVAASITLSDIESKTCVSWHITGFPVKGHLPVIRCLPTLGSSVKAGVTVYTKGRYCNEGDTDPFLTLFSLVSHCEEIPEKYMDAFTAFSGSGVAFMAVALESLADGGVMAGIPRPMAQRIAAHTMMSTAKLVLEKGLHPAEVKDATASPGGTTIRGLQCLENEGFRGALITAVKAAADRATEMNPSRPTT